MRENDRSNLGRIGLTLGLLVALTFGMTGCMATVPLASAERDAESKQFSTPPEGKAGVYIYRTSVLGMAVKKKVRMDGTPLGKVAYKTFSYTEVPSGKHTVSTKSEFGYNSLVFTADEGALYFFEQYLYPGILIGGSSNFKTVSEEKGKAEVLMCKQIQ